MFHGRKDRCILVDKISVRQSVHFVFVFAHVNSLLVCARVASHYCTYKVRKNKQKTQQSSSAPFTQLKYFIPIFISEILSIFSIGMRAECLCYFLEDRKKKCKHTIN